MILRLAALIMLLTASLWQHAQDMPVSDTAAKSLAFPGIGKTRFGCAGHFGFIIPHTPQITHLIQGHSFGAAGTLLREVSGKSYWHYAYNFPEHAFDFQWANTGNPAQFGQQFMASYILHLPLRRKGSAEQNGMQLLRPKFMHYLGIGLGAGYATRIWNLETNHQAAVLGSHLNMALSLQYSARIFRSRFLEMRAGIRITHLSNGSFQVPNLGTNNAGLFIQTIWGNAPYRIMAEPKLYTKPGFQKFNYSITVSGGLKEIPPPYGRKFPIAGMTFGSDMRFSYKSSIGLCLDLFYSEAIQTLLERRAEGKVAEGKVWQAGLGFFYGLHFGDFLFKVQQGFYLKDAWKNDGKLYHRFIIRYNLSDRLYIQTGLKTHFAKADFGEIGGGIMLNKAKRHKEVEP